jgi:hypothetical protein
MKLTIGNYTKKIDESILKEGIVRIDFDGSLKVLIEINDGKMKVINAVDGYGNNCKDEYVEELVSIMP